MYELKDITLYDALKLGFINEEEQELLQEYEIDNVEQLATYVYYTTGLFQKNNFYRVINQANEIIFKIKNHQILTTTTFIHGYGNHASQPILEETDKKTRGNILIGSLTSTCSGNYSNVLKNFDIFTLKYLANHINLLGKNALIANVYGTGLKKFSSLVQKINFYEQQILRIASSTDVTQYQDSLFFKDRIQKMKIVKSEYELIINYLQENGKKYVFGSLGNIQSLKKGFALTNPTSNSEYWLANVSARFTRIISDYTTLEELENGGTHNRTLNRFILK